MKIYYDSKLAKSLLFGSFKTCMFFGMGSVDIRRRNGSG